MGDNVVIGFETNFGTKIVICSSDDWTEIYDAYENDVMVEIEGRDGSTLEVNLFDCVKNAVVAQATEDLILFAENFADDSQSFFDQVCYEVIGEEGMKMELTFVDRMLALINSIEANILETRAIGLGKSHVMFKFRSQLFHAIAKYNGGKNQFYFGPFGGEMKPVTSNYVDDIKAILLEIPDATMPSEQTPTLETDKTEVDFSAFDAAMGL